jgi:hypothetical protein
VLSCRYSGQLLLLLLLWPLPGWPLLLCWGLLLAPTT